MKMNLKLFSGSYTLTVYNDGNFSATTASPSSSLAKDDKSTLTITANSNYELDDIEVISGGATIIEESGAKKVKMGDASAVIFVKGKKSNNYIVTEDTSVCVNDSKTVLHANTTVQVAANGAPIGVTVKNGGTVISASDAVNNLIAAGALVKI